MKQVSKNRMLLRVEYARETELIFSDDIPKYADWLEIKLAKILNVSEEITNNSGIGESEKKS
jgi:hypothetical protein